VNGFWVGVSEEAEALACFPVDSDRGIDAKVPGFYQILDAILKVGLGGKSELGRYGRISSGLAWHCRL